MTSSLRDAFESEQTTSEDVGTLLWPIRSRTDCPTRGIDGVLLMRTEVAGHPLAGGNAFGERRPVDIGGRHLGGIDAHGSAGVDLLLEVLSRTLRRRHDHQGVDAVDKCRMGEERAADALGKVLLAVIALALDRSSFPRLGGLGHEADSVVLGVVDGTIVPFECLGYRPDTEEEQRVEGVVLEIAYAGRLVLVALLPGRCRPIDDRIKGIVDGLDIATPLLQLRCHHFR